MLDNLSTQFTTDFLISIFNETNANIRFDSKNGIRSKWFNSILSKMEVFGLNEVYFNRGKMPRIKPTKLSPYISINNFTIVQINRLYLYTLIKAYPNEDSWSHPFVLHLLKCLCDQDKSHISNNIKIKDMPIYSDFKLFINMIYGMLLTDHCPLSVNDLFFESTFNTALKQLQNKVIELSGVENKLIGYDVDTFLFECDKASLNIENIKTIFDAGILNIESSKDFRTYNVLSNLTKTLDIVITR